jgi:hypothetical protein
MKTATPLPHYAPPQMNLLLMGEFYKNPQNSLKSHGVDGETSYNSGESSSSNSDSDNGDEGEEEDSNEKDASAVHGNEEVDNASVDGDDKDKNNNSNTSKKDASTSLKEDDQNKNAPVESGKRILQNRETSLDHENDASMTVHEKGKHNSRRDEGEEEDDNGNDASVETGDVEVNEDSNTTPALRTTTDESFVDGGNLQNLQNSLKSHGVDGGASSSSGESSSSDLDSNNGDEGEEEDSNCDDASVESGDVEVNEDSNNAPVVTHCIYNMDVGCSLWGFEASTMTL